MKLKASILPPAKCRSSRTKTLSPESQRLCLPFMHGCHDRPMRTHQAKDEELHKWKRAFFSKSNWPLCLMCWTIFYTVLAFVFTHAVHMDTDHMFTLYASFLCFWWEAEGWGCFKFFFFQHYYYVTQRLGRSENGFNMGSLVQISISH